MKQEDLQKLLDSLDEGPLGQKKDWQWEMSARQKGVPKSQAHKDNVKKAAIERSKNPDWIKTRGIQHESNSTKVKVYKGTKVGNAKYGTLDVIDVKYFGTFNSMRDAAKACNVTTSAVSACIKGKIRFAKGFIFEKLDN